MILARGDKHARAEAFVLDASKEIFNRALTDIAVAILSGVFDHESLGSVGFISSAIKLAQANGRNYQIGKPEWFKGTASLLNFPPGLHEARRHLFQLIFEALDLPEETAILKQRHRRLSFCI